MSRPGDVGLLAAERASSEQLQETVAVWHKDEDTVGGEVVGPIALELRNGDRIAFQRPDEVEWFPLVVAEALAEFLGVEVFTT